MIKTDHWILGYHCVIDFRKPFVARLHYHASFNQSEHWGDRNDGSLAESYPNAGDEDPKLARSLNCGCCGFDK